MACIKLLNVVYQWLLVHNPLSKLVVVSVNPRCFLLFGGEVQAADSDWTADRCWPLELMRGASPFMSLFLLLKVDQMWDTHVWDGAIHLTYRVNLLQSIEQPLILAVDVVRVLSGGELKVHGVVLFVLGHAFLVEGDATARRRRWESTPRRPVCLPDFLQAALMLVLRAIKRNEGEIIGCNWLARDQAFLTWNDRRLCPDSCHRTGCMHRWQVVQCCSYDSRQNGNWALSPFFDHSWSSECHCARYERTL